MHLSGFRKQFKKKAIQLRYIYLDSCMPLELAIPLKQIKELYLFILEYLSNSGIVVSHICGDGREYAFRNDRCISSSHGNWNPSKL